MKAAIYTLGCRVNQYESEVFAEMLEQKGIEVFREGGKGCDICIINTCTVTGESDRKSRQFIRRSIKDNPMAAVVVTGCMAQISPDKTIEIDGVDAVVGNSNKLAVVEKAISLAGKKNEIPENCVCALEGREFEKMSIEHSERTRAYIKIEDGCENHCSYCIIPQARGKIRSKLPEDILAEAGQLRRGYHEIVLTGIEVAGYGRDLEGRVSLEDVVCMIDRETGFDRISFGSLEPSFIRPEFIDKISTVKGLSHHFHLSLQSGCDRTLAAMRRKYNTDIIRRNVAHIRQLIPDAMFTADIIVGFPGETQKDFEETCEFVESIGLLYAHVFAYSERPGTPAANMENKVSESVKSERSAILCEICKKNKKRILEEYKENAGVYPVLFEEYKNKTATGRLNNYIEVTVENDEELSGKIRNVRIVGCSEDKLIGILE